MEYIALKDVCKINMGQSPDSSSYNDNEDGIPFFQGNADFGERYPVTRVWCNAPTKIAQPEDILISVRAPIGALNFAKEECCIGRGLAALTPDRSKVSLEFVYWLLKGKKAELNSKGTGSTFKAISRKVLEETMVPAIDFDKQHEYAEILEKIYNVIQKRKEELSALDDLIKARFVELFGDPNTNDMRWTMGVINDIGTCVAGATPSTKVDEYWVDGTIPWMSSGEVNKGRVFETDTFITQLGYDNASTKLVPPKTVVLAMAGQGKTRGMSAITEIELCTNQSICSIVNNDKVDAEYLLCFLRLQYKELRGASTNTDGRGGLNLKIIGNYPIMIPPIEMQKEFADFVKQVDKSKVVELNTAA